MRGVVAPLIKLVVFLLVTTAATYVLAATIANSSFGSTNTYKADFTDAAGLNVGDDVRVAGVRVGTVDRHQGRVEKESGKRVAQVTFSVDKSRPLPKSVDLTLRYRNLVGQRYIDVAQGTGDTGDAAAGLGRAELADASGRRPDRAVPGFPAAVPGPGRRPDQLARHRTDPDPAGRGRQRRTPAQHAGRPVELRRRPRPGDRLASSPISTTSSPRSATATPSCPT